MKKINMPKENLKKIKLILKEEIEKMTGKKVEELHFEINGECKFKET